MRPFAGSKRRAKKGNRCCFVSEALVVGCLFREFCSIVFMLTSRRFGCSPEGGLWKKEKERGRQREQKRSHTRQATHNKLDLLELKKWTHRGTHCSNTLLQTTVRTCTKNRGHVKFSRLTLIGGLFPSLILA